MEILKPRELIISPKPVAIANINRLESHQVIACPNPDIAAVESGKAIAVPNGEFDIGRIQDQLRFQPELVSLSARVMSFLPRGLSKFDCPKVMKIGDTFHFGDGTLSGMIEYCRLLNCDYHWTYQSAHHLHFFAEAGLRNIFWLPGTIVIDEYIPAKPVEKIYDVIFRGGESELHIYRKHILQQLKAANIPIDIQSKSYTDCLEDYAKARIVVNCSLNGDLNRRVFEVLMSGGFLLSDRISTQTGLFELFQEGIHFECYGNESELLEKIQFYLEHPDKAEQIARTGQQKLLQHYRQQEIQQKLYRYIFTNQIDSCFQLKHDPRSQICKDEIGLELRTKIYEFIQELHRLTPQLNVLYWNGRNQRLLADLEDLPRLKLVYTNNTNVKDQIQTTFQVVLIDTSEEIDELQKEVQIIAPFLENSGFLLIVGSTSFSTKLMLNRSLPDLIPITAFVKLFEQIYPIRLDSYASLYQKTNSNQLTASNLIIQRITIKKMIKNQIENFPIIDRAFKFIRHRFSSITS